MNTLKYTSEYALTVTTSRRCHNLTTEEQYKESKKELIDILELNKIQHSLIFELTKNNDVHYHGIIKVPVNDKIRDIKIFVCNLFRKRKFLGYICLKEITEYNIWFDYMKKELKITNERTGIYPIVSDMFGVFEIIRHLPMIS